MKCMLLAAGMGTRLLPLTDDWPKCLMPVRGKALLEYWLEILDQLNIHDVLVNKHHHADIVDNFLNRSKIKNWVSSVYESELLGTAGTLRRNRHFFKDDSVLVIHADNWCCCDFSDFVSYHENSRPAGTLITMMTFETTQPEKCGIAEINEQGVVIDFHEKVSEPPGFLANAAIYIIEPEVIEWINDNDSVSDISTEVLPHFFKKIATWKNTDIHKDIGSIEMLKSAQFDVNQSTSWHDDWQKCFLNNPIHRQIKNHDR